MCTLASFVPTGVYDEGVYLRGWQRKVTKVLTSLQDDQDPSALVSPVKGKGNYVYL